MYYKVAGHYATSIWVSPWLVATPCNLGTVVMLGMHMFWTRMIYRIMVEETRHLEVTFHKQYPYVRFPPVDSNAHEQKYAKNTLMTNGHATHKHNKRNWSGNTIPHSQEQFTQTYIVLSSDHKKSEVALILFF